MKIMQVKSIFILTFFTSAVLFSAEPSEVQEASPPQPIAEEAKAISPSIQAMESIPHITTKKDIDKATDMFLKGGFCVITALLFLTGFLVVKNNPGQHTHAEA